MYTRSLCVFSLKIQIVYDQKILLIENIHFVYDSADAFSAHIHIVYGLLFLLKEAYTIFFAIFLQVLRELRDENALKDVAAKAFFQIFSLNFAPPKMIFQKFFDI